MKKRIALLVSAMLTGVAVATISISAASAADECLARPKGLAPAGKHWYYSTDRKLQRKCWYLDDAGEKIVTPAPRKQPVVAATAPAANGAQNAPSQTVDARAELVEEPRAEQPAAPAVVAPSAPAQLLPPQNGADGAVQRDWTMASRWPAPSDAFAAAPASTLLDATPAARTEAAPSSMPMQDQPAAVGDGGIAIDLGLIAAGAIFLVVIGGMIILLSRRNAAPRDRMIASAIERDARPWTRLDEAGVAPLVRPREQRTRHEAIDEIEQLLEARRQVPG